MAAQKLFAFEDESTSWVRTQLQARSSEHSPLKHSVLKNTEAKPEDSDGSTDSQTTVLEQLTKEVRKLETSERTPNAEPISTGCQAMDECLAEAGYLPGCVVEYLRASPGCGASYLALAAAAKAVKQTAGYLIIVDPHQHFYPPAIRCHGISLEQVIFVHPESHADTIWVIDQALRTEAVAAVIADVNSVDDRAARRLQLAAEQGNGLGLLLRSISAKNTPSWAEVQWTVRSRMTYSSKPTRFDQKNRLIEVQLGRARGGKVGTKLNLSINKRTGEIESLPSVTRHEQRQASSKGTLYLASQLASATRASRRAEVG